MKRVGIVAGVLGGLGVVAYLGAHLGGWVPDYAAIQRPETLSGAVAMAGAFLWGAGKTIEENRMPDPDNDGVGSPHQRDRTARTRQQKTEGNRYVT